MFNQLNYQERVNTVAAIVKAQLGTTIENKDMAAVKATCIAWEVPVEAVLVVISQDNK